jgi:hypothetical protein
LLPLLDAEVQTAPHEENDERPHQDCDQRIPWHRIGKPQDETGREGDGNGCDHGRRGCFQLKSDPRGRLSQQPTAKRAQGATSKKHEDDRDCLFIDVHTLSQKRMNRFEKIEKIEAAPSDDLDLPKGPQIQESLSIHG